MSAVEMFRRQEGMDPVAMVYTQSHPLHSNLLHTFPLLRLMPPNVVGGANVQRNAQAPPELTRRKVKIVILTSYKHSTTAVCSTLFFGVAALP